MDSTESGFLVLAALGVRVIEIDDWEPGATYLRRFRTLLVDSELSPEDRGHAACHALGMAAECP